MQDEYDVIIIGARVAGASLAGLLGQAGCHVLLVDRAIFPSPTLSTHFFRGGGFGAVLERLGALEQVLALSCPPLTREYWYQNGEAEPVVKEPQNPGELGYNLSVQREWLDDVVLRQVLLLPTVELAQQSRATELLWQGERVVGVRMIAQGQAREARARLVVGADGRHSFVAKKVDARVEESEPGHRATYYYYVRDLPGPLSPNPDGPEFSTLGDEIAYVFPSDHGLSCVALSTAASEFPQLRSAGGIAYFNERIAAHKGIGPRYAGAKLEGQLYGTGPEPNFVRVPIGKGWVLLGDAGIHLDPFVGLGMDMAGNQALFLSEALLGWLHGTESEADVLATFHARRNEDELEMYRYTVEMSRDLRQLIA